MTTEGVAQTMTRVLTRLADIAYRRRGRVVLAWIVAAVVIIGVGSSLAGEYQADYDTPGSESKAASDITEQRFAGYSGQEIYVVWKDPEGADSPRPSSASTRSSPRPRRSITSPRTCRSGSPEDGTIGIDLAPADGPRLGGQEGGRREADRRRRGERRRRAADQARRRSDLRGAGAVEPRGDRVPRRRDRAADRLRLGGRRRPAAGDRPHRPRHLIGRPDRPARQRHRRPRLDHRGVRADRDRRRHRLFAARPDPVPLGDARRQGPPRRRGRGRDHRRAQRDHRRARPW